MVKLNYGKIKFTKLKNDINFNYKLSPLEIGSGFTTLAACLSPWVREHIQTSVDQTFVNHKNEITHQSDKTYARNFADGTLDKQKMDEITKNLHFTKSVSDNYNTMDSDNKVTTLLKSPEFLQCVSSYEKTNIEKQSLEASKAVADAATKAINTDNNIQNIKLAIVAGAYSGWLAGWLNMPMGSIKKSAVKTPDVAARVDELIDIDIENLQERQIHDPKLLQTSLQEIIDHTPTNPGSVAMTKTAELSNYTQNAMVQTFYMLSGASITAIGMALALTYAFNASDNFNGPPWELCFSKRRYGRL